MTNNSNVSGMDFTMPPDIGKIDRDIGKHKNNYNKKTFLTIYIFQITDKIEKFIPPGTPGYNQYMKKSYGN
jgi:hypothetical protein